MEDTLTDVIDLIEALPQIEPFKDLTDDEIRKLAVDLMKIEAARSTGNAVSNAITHLEFNM